MGPARSGRTRMRAACWALAAVIGATAAADGGTVGGKDGPVPVFPAPVRMEAAGGRLALDAKARIVVPDGEPQLRWVAHLLAGELGRALGAPGGELEVVKEGAAGKAAAPADIHLYAGPSGRRAAGHVGDLGKKLSDRSGGYVLRVSPKGIAILGRDAAGTFYGALTLLQLFSKAGAGRGEIVRADVIDFPYHSYRGMRATLPRGKPRRGEVTHAYYKDLLRLMALARLNHVWVQGCSWCVPLKRHPEMAWSDALTVEQAGDIVGFARRRFLSMDGSLDFAWLYYKYKHLAEIPEGETWDSLKAKVRRMSRVNPCPANPELRKLVAEVMEDTMDVLSGDHYAVSLDEMYQEYHGSRWGVCPRCKGKDPVKLWADMANRLIAAVLKKGRAPILGGGMLMYEHQGWYKDIYKAIDLIEDRDKVVIYNWSEGHIRRGAMVVKGKRLKNETFSATPFFKKHGYKDVMHLFAGTRWQGRPEMREVKGKLDCYGGFVSYYHAMNYEFMKHNGTLDRLVFTAQHLWSPDLPAMDSPADRKACRYGQALADAVLAGKSYVEAIALARKAYAAPPGTLVLKGGTLGRGFQSKSKPVVLFAKQRGDRTEGTMEIVLPVEEANPAAAYLVLTMYDWDQSGEGEIYLNGHKLTVPTSRRSNGRDYRFPAAVIPKGWLKFGPEPNVLRFVYKGTAGFIVRTAEIVVSDRSAGASVGTGGTSGG